MFERFSDSSRRCVIFAQEGAQALGSTWLSDEHLLLGIVKEGENSAARLLADSGVTPEALLGVFVPSEPTGNRPSFTPTGKRALEYALRESLVAGNSSIEPNHLLLGVLRVEGVATQILTVLGVDQKKMREELGGMETVDENRRGSKSGKKQKALKEFGRNLTECAREGKLDPVIGRDKEVSRVLEILCRRTKSNPILVGEAGVGKTAVAEAVAQVIASDSVPQPLEGVEVWDVDLGGMVAGTRYRGDFEERIKKVIKEASEPNIVLFIDEVHTVLGVGQSNSGGMGAAEMLKPAMARGELRVIGATTEDEFRLLQKDKALERRFMPVRVDEPSKKTTRLILEKLEPVFGEHHGLVATKEALDAAVDLTARHLPERNFPDKAIDVMDEAMAKVVLHLPQGTAAQRRDVASARRNAGPDPAAEADLVAAGIPFTLELDDVVATVSEMAGVTIAIDDQRERLMNLEAVLEERIIGQKNAISTVAKTVRRMRAGLADVRRIGGAFLFVGPTGVGKTETARVVADELFGGHLVQIDMSEYMESHSVSRLIGAPPGYVGYDEPGQLTEAVRRQPESVVLLDEIEKAHPDVLNLLLQLFEEGRLTDAQGRVIDFTRTIVIMTSNLGVSELARPQVGFNTKGQKSTASREVLERAVRDHLRPELLGRIDDVVVFEQLGNDEIVAIATIMLRDLSARLQGQGVDLAWGDDALGVLAQRGYDPSLGARPMRRAIGRLVEDPLSEMLLAGSLKPGQTALLVGIDGGLHIDVADTNTVIEELDSLDSPL